MPPTSDPLSGVRAKIDRAKQHLADFDNVRVRFRDTNRDMIGFNENSETGYRTYYLKGNPNTTDFALWVGDIVQNLRSALDHLAYAMCVAGPGGTPAAEAKIQKINFPISRGDSKAYNALESRGVVIALAKAGVEQALDEVEPYKGGKGDVLRQISVLNNTDKHRLLVTVGLSGARPDVALYTGEDYTYSRFLLIPDPDRPPLKAGDEFMFEPLSNKLHEHMQFMFDIALNEPQVAAVETLRPLLPDMAQYVETLIPAFERFVY